MAANTSPIFPLTPNCAPAVIAAANTARDGSGALVTLLTAGVNGARVDWIKWTSAQATAAALSGTMVARVWLTDASDANIALIAEGVITSATASNLVAGAYGFFDFVNGTYTNTAGTVVSIGINGGLIVNAGYKIKVTQSIYVGVQDRMSVFPKAGDF